MTFINLINYILSKSSGGGNSANVDAQKGVAGGIASLDNNGKVPTSQLPSYVDDVIEYPSMANFPSVGVSGIIYIAADTNMVYRWGGSTYIAIGAGDSLVIDDAPTENSNHLISSGAVYNAIQGLLTKINQLSIKVNELQTQIDSLDNLTAEIEQLKTRISTLESNQQSQDDGLNIIVDQQDLVLTGINANVDNDGFLIINSNQINVDNNNILNNIQL